MGPPVGYSQHRHGDISPVTCGIYFLGSEIPNTPNENTNQSYKQKHKKPGHCSVSYAGNEGMHRSEQTLEEMSHSAPTALT